VYNGELFAGTLPSGRVWSIRAGSVATLDNAFPAGWHHLAAVRNRSTLSVYLDGVAVAASGATNPGYYDLSAGTPLRIGAGAHDFLTGRLSDFRVYSRALSALEVASLAS